MNESKSNRVLKLEEHRTVQGKEYCPCSCHQKTLGDFMEITDEYAEEVFGLRMTEGQLEKLKRTAGKLDQTYSDFAREAIQKAVDEKAEDSKRIGKTKR